jgi:hypothetical protein
MMDDYHPSPVIKHLNGLWDYRKLGMASPVSLTGHSTPYVFRFMEDDGKVIMGYKEWPFRATPYSIIDVTGLADAFTADLEPVHSVNDKGTRAFEAMNADLNKWKAGGKLHQEDVHWK